MNQGPVYSFENFRPRMKPGKVIPQGRRIIFETADGGKRIVLPVEMADAILLAGGNYTMREIIEKVFRRKGSVHFKTLFKTFQTLRSQGFLENGEELENYSVLPASAKWYRRLPVLEIPLLKSKIEARRQPALFYAVSMAAIILGIWGAAEIPWPPITDASLQVQGSHGYGLIFIFVGLSALLCLQGAFRGFLLLLLTGNLFGLNVVICPWGIFLRSKDESLYLVTDSFYLLLFHTAILSITILPLVLIAHYTPALFLLPHFATVIALRLFFDLSPLVESEFVKCIRSLLSLTESDIVAGYVKDSSILSLLSPLSVLAQRRRLRQMLSVYYWTWALALFFGSTYCMDILDQSLERDWLFTSVMWLLPLSGISFAVWKMSQDIHAYVVIPVWRSLTRVFNWLKPIKKKAWSRDRLKETLAGLPVFSALNSAMLDQMVNDGEVIHCRRGSRVITQGEMGRHLFVLLEGCLSVERVSSSEGRQHLTSLRPITIFGEVAIVEEAERTADVIAVEHSMVIKIPVDSIKKAAVEDQYIGEGEAFKSAILVNQFFALAPMFRDLSPEVIESLVARCRLLHFPADGVVFRQGSHGQSFYMVVRGSVDVLINEKLVKRIKQGGFFGEIAVIADIARTATVKAHEPLAVLQIAASSFWEILSQNIELAMFIETVGETRLKEDIEHFQVDVSGHEEAS